MSGALAGLRVIELGEGFAVPCCAKLFADFGADVIKVEPPAGDVARSWGPFPDDQPHPERSGTFYFLGSNKRGIVLDLDAPEGRERLDALLGTADLLIEGLPAERLDAIGLDPTKLPDRFPELVVVSLTPFGRSGPYARWHATDLNAYHLSGASSRYCGRPGEAPLEHGAFAADFFGAAAAAAWGLAAVHGRATAGGGQHLDVSSAEAIAAAFVGGQNIGGYAQDGRYEKRTGVGMPLGAPATILPCKDGHVWMLALEPGQWNGLVEVMGNPDWAAIDLFQDMFQRAQNSDMIYPLIGEWAAEHSKWEIMERAQAKGAPVTAVFTVPEAAEHPHLKERGYVVELPAHPELGVCRTLGAPFRLPACPGGPSTPAPCLGQHTDAVLAELDAGPRASDAAASGRAAAAPEVAPPLESLARVAVAPRRGAGEPARSGAPARPGALPLEGIRVANFGWVWAGPVVGQTLGFLGADVLKIESRARIDMTRNLPPFGEGVRDPNRSLSNHACWAMNGSVSLNLKEGRALDLTLELIRHSDVVVENFGPGAMEKMGLGYEVLRQVRPDLVMLSMPAAGLSGPLRNVRTYGLSLTSLTGLDSLVGYKGGDPVPVENAYSDPLNGILAAFAVVTALAHRDRTGEGQHVDFSQQEAVMQLVGPAFMDWVLNQRTAGPIGNEHPLGAAVPHGVFPCAGDDRWISIAVTSDDAWRGLVEELGSPAWATASELATLAGRRAAVDELHANLAAWTAGEDVNALTARLQARGIAAAPVLDVADLLADPHYRARGTFVEVTHPLGFRETLYGPYVKMSRSRPEVRPGPMIGADNERVFKDLLGLDDARYQELIDAKVIY